MLNMQKPKLIIFSSGTKTGGGSGFENLVNARNKGTLDADIVAVVSSRPEGGVYEKAKQVEIPFMYFEGPYDAKGYRRIIRKTGAQWVALSGWLKLVTGLDPARTFNIHPGPLPEFGGPGMYGHHVHEAVMSAYCCAEISESAVTMHFVTEKYDDGPIFFQIPVVIERNDTPESLADRVNQMEHEWQPTITNMVIHEKIFWDGEDPKSLRVPSSYPYLPKK